MKKKLKTFRKMRLVAKRKGNTKEKKRLFRKCYMAYFMQCVIHADIKFTLRFNGVYTQNFWERFKAWYRYSKNPKKYLRPIYSKITNAPNELVLEDYLKACNMYVIQEYLYPVKTFYDIVMC